MKRWIRFLLLSLMFTCSISGYIPQSGTRLEFGPLISSRGSTIKKGSILELILTPFLSLNPGALTQPKFQPCARLGYTQDHAFGAKIRLGMLKRSDQFLDMITNQKTKNYSLAEPLRTLSFTNNVHALISFSESYGYFSMHPLIGHVSDDPEDLNVVLRLFTDLSQAASIDGFAKFAIEELLTKALAYRDLTQGQRLDIPVKKGALFGLETFTVDHVFNLWNGMPAFGLIPDKKGIASLLLFRGTDLALYSKRGWASVLSDVDMAGPGLSVFMQSRSEIHQWLDKAAKENKKAIVLGFSLGGCLAAYTFLYENELLNEKGSVSFNAPGFSESVHEEWNQLSDKKRLQFVSYVNRGDIISKKGYLFGPAFELSTDLLMKPIFAHTILMSGQSRFTLAQIDVPEENARRYAHE